MAASARFVLQQALLHKPALYLLDFFERNRASYYDALMGVRVSADSRTGAAS